MPRSRDMRDMQASSNSLYGGTCAVGGQEITMSCKRVMHHVHVVQVIVYQYSAFCHLVLILRVDRRVSACSTQQYCMRHEQARCLSSEVVYTFSCLSVHSRCHRVAWLRCPVWEHRLLLFPCLFVSRCRSADSPWFCHLSALHMLDACLVLTPSMLLVNRETGR